MLDYRWRRRGGRIIGSENARAQRTDVSANGAINVLDEGGHLLHGRNRRQRRRCREHASRAYKGEGREPNQVT
jgi:hypothetical protein